MELALGGVFGGAEMALGGISEYTNTSAMWNNNSISAKLAASFKSATCLERKKRNSVDAASAAESSSLVWTLHARHRVRNGPRRSRDSLPAFPPAALMLIFNWVRFEAFDRCPFADSLFHNLTLETRRFSRMP
jgi:hypothetical protein